MSAKCMSMFITVRRRISCYAGYVMVLLLTQISEGDRLVNGSILTIFTSFPGFEVNLREGVTYKTTFSLEPALIRLVIETTFSSLSFSSQE